MHEKSNSRYRLRGSYRLKRSVEFRTVFGRHKKVQNRLFRILVHYKDQPTARLGIIVSKRVSRRAVDRNRIKRQVRECFRINRKTLRKANLVIVANKGCASATNAELQNALSQLFKRLNK